MIEFILANASMLIIAVVILGVIALNNIVTPILVKKGILKDNTTGSILDAISIARLVLEVVDLGQDGDKIKSKSELLFSIAEKVVKHVEQTLKNESGSEKKRVALESINLILESLGIEVDDLTKQLIEIAIESSVFDLPLPRE